ncbi:M20 family metallopeptidase [Mycolicibacterium palauense]|uniref:M20 family metallopeptidase n=1 Tax=Mycolicibacterium palauense TaxID=2034511 RepID=UPI000BFF016A|nr:M20 family metallopeptidase [Mycolicibacterium palauense]
MSHRDPLTTVDAEVQRRRRDLLELSHSLHAEPELAFDEHRSCAKTQALAAEQGFEITPAPGGVPTAFRAVYGSGSLVLGVCAEYDALPEIGHACGHNIIAAAGVGAALALAEVADTLDLTVVLLGTPAEEAGGGKVLLLEAGAFDDIAAAAMIHPGPRDIACPRSLALSDVAVDFTGREAHAAVAPYAGRNAADAATVAQVAIGLLRQHLAPGQMVHGIVTEGGQAPNVIPAHAAMRYIMRADTTPSLDELRDRVTDCLRAGALAAGCEFSTLDTEPRYLELTPDAWLSGIVADEMLRQGRVPVSPQVAASSPFGSTDMGNVSQAMPAIHPIVGIDAHGASIHQTAFARAAAGPSGDAAVLDGAVMLARTLVRLAQSGAERDRLGDLRAARPAGARPSR